MLEEQLEFVTPSLFQNNKFVLNQDLVKCIESNYSKIAKTKFELK